MLLFYMVLSLVIRETISQRPFEIEDIPIEQFEHAEAQNDEFDVELMPRPSRSLFLETLDLERQSRDKRQAEEPKDDVVKALGQPLEIAEIDPENTTQVSSSSPGTREGEDAEDLMIDDFIRFRRASEQEGLKRGEKFAKNEKTSSFSSPDQKPSQQQQRDTRGTTKSQWVKLPYQVERSDELNYEDSLQSADTIRAPRVHFVTQNLEPERKYDHREPRSRNNKDYPTGIAHPVPPPLPRAFSRDMSAEMDYYQPRYQSRNYEPVPYRRQRYDPYYDPEPRTGRQFFPYDRPYDYPPERPVKSGYNTPEKRQRRIIYYATLPEIPPSRDRYYGNRYYEPYPYRKEGDPYRKGEGPYAAKPRYEEHPVEKAFPVKVSTDLNVREVKKNPERRIYSDVERDRYNQGQGGRM